MAVQGTPAAVLFDMDGTLLDSEKLWDAALTALAERLGGVLSAPARLSMLGTPVLETLAILHRDLGRDTFHTCPAWSDRAESGGAIVIDREPAPPNTPAPTRSGRTGRWRR